MATFDFTTDRMPAGTTVRAFPASARRADGPPIGEQLASATVSSLSTVTFSGLDPDTAYVAYAEVGGQHVYVTFRTSPVESQDVLGQLAAQLGDVRWRHGNGAPDDAVGAPGDYYVDDSADTLTVYGPKGSEWPEDPLPGTSSASGAVLPWAPLTDYVAGEPMTHGGAVFTRDTAGTSRATFDPTEAALWTLLPGIVAAFDATSSYVAGDVVTNAGALYQAPGDLAPGAFDAGDWTALSGAPGPAGPAGTVDGTGGITLEDTANPGTFYVLSIEDGVLVTNPYVPPPGPFTPASLDPVAWFSAESLVLADGADVTTWPDISGNGHHATGGNPPNYRETGIGDRPSVEFEYNGSDYLSLGDLSSLFPTAATVLAVFMPTAAQYVVFSTRSIANGFWSFGGTGYFDVFHNGRIDGFPAVVPTQADGLPHQIHVRSGASNYRVRIDGDDQTPQAGAYHAGDLYQIGKESSGGGYMWGHIAQLVLIDRVLTDDEIADFEAWARDLYPELPA